MTVQWWFLSGAIAAEVIATSSMRAAAQAESSARTWWVVVVAGYLAAFALFFAALDRGAPLAASYAIWAGAGAALTAVAAWLVFSERLTIGAAAGIALVVAGVVLIELFGDRQAVGA